MTATRTLKMAAQAWLMAAFGLAVAVPPAQAGCGCDHPPPTWTPVMPPFASPGDTVRIYPDDSLEVGETYDVTFEGHGPDPTLEVRALRTDFLEVTIPAALEPGPKSIDVDGEDVEQTFRRSDFTALPPARRIPAQTGRFKARDFEAAVADDGTVYVPVDVSDVRDATQFALAFLDLPLVYGRDDVIIYNTDGVDLTLFTLDVENATQRQWGDYFGWEVANDTTIFGDVYDNKVETPYNYATMSDVFTYWRHEFHTYAAAHAPGGSHEVDASGSHPDGTLHIDHDHLVLAIRGLERSSWNPDDLTQAMLLSGGARTVDLGWVSIVSPNPVDSFDMALEVEYGVDDTSPDLPESD